MRGMDLKMIKSDKASATLKDEVKNKASFFDILNKDIQLFGHGMSDKVKESFYLEMNMLLSAGIDIRNAFDLVLNEKMKKSTTAMFEAVRDEIIEGSSLSEALKKSNKFSEYEYFSVQIGEETGKLPEILQDLSNYYAKK